MANYISFISMSMTLAIIGSAYYFGAKYLAIYIDEEYRQVMATGLGVLAVSIGYKMMTLIEEDLDHIIEDTENLANRILTKIRKDRD